MANRNFEGVMAGLTEALAHAEGRPTPGLRVHIPATFDVKALRRRLAMTQEQFAMAYGFSLGQLRDWEQGRSAPAASDRVLLTVIDRAPEAVNRALEVV